MGVGDGLYMYDVVVKKFTFAFSSPIHWRQVLYRSADGIGFQFRLQIIPLSSEAARH